MPVFTSPTIRLKPILRGEPSAITQRTILRTLREPNYLSLSQNELKVVDEMVGLDLSLESFIKWHLEGKQLPLRDAMNLLVRLRRNGFLEEESSRSLASHLEKLDPLHGSPYSVQRFVKYLWRLFDYPLFRFELLESSRFVSELGRYFLNPFSLLIQGLCVISFRTPILQSVEFALSQVSSLQYPLEIVFFAACFGYSVASSLVPLIQSVFFVGMGKGSLRFTLHFTGFCSLRVSLLDDDMLLLKPRALLRYATGTLLVPWLLCAVAYKLSVQLNLEILRVLSSCFALQGLVLLCPFYRSPIIKMTEGLTRILRLLEGSRQYIDRQLILALLRIRLSSANTQQYFYERTLLGLAIYTLLWLFAFGMLAAHFLVEWVPFIQMTLDQPQSWLSVLTVFLIYSILIFGVTIIFLRLFSFLSFNLNLVLKFPFQHFRFRKAIPASKASLENTLSFLKNIVIFSELDEEALLLLAQRLKYSKYNAGDIVIAEGEKGTDFFVLYTGEAKIITRASNGIDELISILHPGDCVGETALIENRPRTATVITMEPCEFIMLSQSDFDQVFPKDSQEGRFLSLIIQRIKLIKESPALSHLSAPQIREFLHYVDAIDFTPGEIIMHEGERADSMFVIECGKARVYNPVTGTTLSYLSRSDLIGVIGVMKGTRRTADVVAETQLSCLRIDRGVFLKICLSNVYVSVLLDDLSEKQLAEVRAA